mmetsp:Transcript_17742/g.19229  ORF Transcript_17742/g.19229 Transcript_17742/m.19229 type:complete len:564 (-) Transcript_17742:154-1845(-)
MITIKYLLTNTSSLSIRSYYRTKKIVTSSYLYQQQKFLQSSRTTVISQGKEEKEMSTPRPKYDYDLIVIGGGSGGMSASKQAASLGAKVLLFDYVKPSTQGSKWGIGGTCVNVGCVPKKLMHFTGLLGQGFHDSKELGWQIGEVKHDWNQMVQRVQDHIHMLNFRYRGALRSKEVNYLNALATFVDRHTVSYNDKNVEKTVTAENIIIAVGGRPTVPSDIPGAVEYAITSDDVFSLKKAPGKTLCVGASYISLECAGFLTELGFDVSVAVRSILLRGFDRQSAEKIGTVMEELGTKFLNDTVVTSIEKIAGGRLQVALHNSKTDEERVEVFDTVLFATGRYADLHKLNLESTGVHVNPHSGKIPVENEVTNVSNIFAIGDICEGTPELTPVAIKAGELLAKRLYGNSTKLMDYQFVPTTVFTPVEYGSVGYSEEAAIKKYGAENIEVFLSEFTTLEVSAVHRMKRKRSEGDEDEDMGPNCLAKLVCLKNENNKVVGFHFVGPNAGEITQGFALAVKLGATKEDFDDLVGIHPTDAESFCALSVTKSSGDSWVAAGGCGGGVCG